MHTNRLAILALSCLVLVITGCSNGTEGSQAAGKRLQEVKGQAGQATLAAREKATEGLKQGYDRVRKDFDDLNSDVNAYVRDNPGRFVLMAAGIGFVLGMLLHRDR